jgi:hypothetical protein
MSERERERDTVLLNHVQDTITPPPSLVVDFSARKALKILASQLEFIAQQ